jgi:uncharacterized damage-inducible protein DinB
MDATDLTYFRMLARYNRFANQRLYDACVKLTDAEYRKPRASFFGSIHATLNHILVADRLWMGRFTGHPAAIKALNQILYDDFVGLRVARDAEDAQIIRYCDALDLPTLNTTLRYRKLAEPHDSMATPLRATLGHFFNHQTHHRGQVHGLLSQTAIAPPVLDLLAYMRETIPNA